MQLHHSMWHSFTTLIDCTTKGSHPIQSNGATSLPQVDLECANSSTQKSSLLHACSDFIRLPPVKCSSILVTVAAYARSQQIHLYLAQIRPLGTDGAHLRPKLQTSASSHGANSA
jgi:hypothetical protein